MFQSQSMFQPQSPHSRRFTFSTLRTRMGREDGISLVIALGMLVVLAALSTSAMAFIRSNQHNAVLSQADLQARTNAEAGLHAAYSLLSRQSTTGGTPSAPTLLGCAASTVSTGASDCSSPQPLCMPVAGTCAAGAAKNDGT